MNITINVNKIKRKTQMSKKTNTYLLEKVSTKNIH